MTASVRIYALVKQVRLADAAAFGGCVQGDQESWSYRDPMSSAPLDSTEIDGYVKSLCQRCQADEIGRAGLWATRFV